MNYQLSRRLFLRSSTALGLSQLLAGCSRSEVIEQILFLENSIPPQLVKGFKKLSSRDKKVEFKPQSHIPQIFDSLFSLQQERPPERGIIQEIEKVFNRSKTYLSLATLGDTWLSSAIAENLIQPLPIKSLANWQKLPISWQKLVQRDPQGRLADNGAVYGAPYRWGGTLIAYRSDKLDPLKIEIKDWADLWRVELRDRISLLDSPREVIGLTLKMLGESYNTVNLSSVAGLEAELKALQQQTKLYSSERYLEPLILGDTWAAVAWSADILPLLKRYPEIKVVAPQSGTSLWADIWVKPQLASTASTSVNEAESSLVREWINYCWEAQAATQISLFTDGISPILKTLPTDNLPQNLRENKFISSLTQNSAKNEFILPLTPAVDQQYRDLWLKIRQSPAPLG
ncbi:MAG: extracellular solute-binding protein [Cyanobacteria bacterium J06623_7]